MKRVFERKAGRASGWPGGRNTALLMALAALVLPVAGCSHPLPQPHSAAAQLYAQRCGGCHYAYAPHSLTAAMWEVQVKMMEVRMRKRGLPTMTDEERQTILKYLKRNAERD